MQVNKGEKLKIYFNDVFGNMKRIVMMKGHIIYKQLVLICEHEEFYASYVDDVLPKGLKMIVQNINNIKKLDPKTEPIIAVLQDVVDYVDPEEGGVEGIIKKNKYEANIYKLGRVVNKYVRKSGIIPCVIVVMHSGCRDDINYLDMFSTVKLFSVAFDSTSPEYIAKTIIETTNHYVFNETPSYRVRKERELGSVEIFFRNLLGF